MKKIFVFLIVICLVFTFFAAVQAEEDYYYNRIDRVFDWGTSTTKVVINLQTELSEDVIDYNSFNVEVKRLDIRKDSTLIESGQRKVLNDYVSNASGKKTNTGKFVTLELEVGPAISIDSAISYDLEQNKNDWIKVDYRIEQIKDIETKDETVSGLVITKLKDIIRPQLEAFNYSSFTYNDQLNGEIRLTYADYKPEINDGVKKPLVIWLHGGGEGGTDPTIPLAGNKSVNLASKEIQQIYESAYVLVPQTPTRWMDAAANEREFEHLPTNSGENGLPYTSKYTATLINLIKSYVKKNPEIDTNRIYLGGCSNGGFMTLRLGIDYPDYFAALYPVCHGMDYNYLTDGDINKLVDQNIWFVSAATDTILPAPDFTLPLYDRLIKEGAENVYLSYPETVVDTSGLYRDEKGKAYEYPGHWSWIYVYNNDLSNIIDGKTVYIHQWLARQNKLYK